MQMKTVKNQTEKTTVPYDYSNPNYFFSKMATSTPPKSATKIALLQKGVGPRLFQFRDKPFPSYDGQLSSYDGPPIRSCDRSPRTPDKRIVVKCIEEQSINSKYAQRLRVQRGEYPSSQLLNPGIITTKREVQRKISKMKQASQAQLDKLEGRKPKLFPPPHFMPKWNPRRQDRTYLHRTWLDDPWLLPVEKRRELQKQTGLRLKSMSRHYQYKVGSNLPRGQEALGAECTCLINYCEHCQALHSTNRCPLHMQVLDPIDPDCKITVYESCPYAKPAEDMRLEEINDVAIYFSEVVRRLRAGEITETPKFPKRFLNQLDPCRKTEVMTESMTSLDSNLNVKKDTESCGTQTEAFTSELIENKENIKDSVAQTDKLDRDPVIWTGYLKILQDKLPFKPCTISDEKNIQVNPCDIGGIRDRVEKLVDQLTEMIFEATLSELAEEAAQQEANSSGSELVQKYMDNRRAIEFRIYQENFRHNVNIQHSMQLELEMAEESFAERIIGAILFSNLFCSTISAAALNSMMKSGAIENTELTKIQGEYSEELNSQVRVFLSNRAIAEKFIEDITTEILATKRREADRENNESQGFSMSADDSSPQTQTTDATEGTDGTDSDSVKVVMQKKEEQGLNVDSSSPDTN